MCTVSYLPPFDGRGFILTSNRDERMHRNTIEPRLYNFGELQLCYPKDVMAGGSWIAANNEGRLACLLNGGFTPHKKMPVHTHSRGRVLIDLVASQQDPMVFLCYYDLSRTEPFTVITIDQSKGGISEFTEFIWDGSGKYLKNLDSAKPYFWSSVTLYSESDRMLRREWFNKFVQENGTNITPEKVYSFHTSKHSTDESINLLMERNEELKTVSITQVKPVNDNYSMQYFDLVENATHIQKV
jgi:hypothetical protein